MTRPVVQLVAALVLMLAGAWLIGWWAVGVVLVAAGILVAFDAFMRDDRRRADVSGSVADVLERWRNAR